MHRAASLLILIQLFAFKSFAFKDDKKNEAIVFQGYAGGMWAPFGITMGATFKKGHGFYVNGRCNHHILKTSRYYFTGNQVNNNSLHWTYDDKKVYSRWEINAGAIFKLKERNGKILRVYVGGGVERPRYLYSFKKSQSKTVDHQWVEYKEISGYMYNTEAGLILNPKRKWYLQMGASSLTRKHEIMFTFGIGRGL